MQRKCFFDAACSGGFPSWYGKCIIFGEGAKPRPVTINVEHLGVQKV